MRRGLLFALGSLLLCCQACAKGKPARDAGAAVGNVHAEVGKQAPDLAIQTVDGKRKITLDTLAGKVVILDFWATWCGPCKESFPKLEELRKKAGDQVEIIGVSVDDTKDGIADFVKETGVTFPIAWDENHANASRWKMGTMPTTFIIDATGKVRHIHDGYRKGEAEVMAKEVAALSGEAGGGGPDKAADERRADKASEDKRPEEKRGPEEKKDKGEDKKAEATAATAATPTAEEPTPPRKKKARGASKKGTKRAGKRKA